MKNKFALCFRPVVMETEESDKSDHAAVSKDIIVAKIQRKNGMMRTSMSPSYLNSKNHSRNTLSRVLKTILYATSPRLRIQNGKIPQLTFPVKTNYDDHLEDKNSPLEKMDDAKPIIKHKRVIEADIISDHEENKKIISSISSSPSFSSNTSSPSTSLRYSSDHQSTKDLMKSLSMKRSLARSRSNSFNQKKRAKTTEANDKILDTSSLLNATKESKDTVFYWMVLALLSTILWDKVFAIILASLWLYFIPSRSGIDGKVPENGAVNLREMEETISDSREYKKKIIMEGLLERKSQYYKEH